MKTPAETFARGLAPRVTRAVRSASVLKTRDRINRLEQSFDDLEAARTEAAAIKDDVLANLETYLVAFIEKAQANGIQIHPAATPEDARRIILEICARNPGIIVKGKSMATEEIHLNHALEEAGFEVVETDLGEYVVQIDGDTPSHIVTPIIHKDRIEIATSFHREGLGEYTEDPGELALQARWRLRDKFRNAKVGISGVNFAVAETGQLVIVENEGNNRLSTTAPDIHIAVMGIEKLIPLASDLPLFLKLLAGSATGQSITTYTHFIRTPAEDGPDEIHIVLLDAGRRDILNSRYRAILRCIRCGACLNVCPVYRQVSGHGYGHVYPGPVGAVLAPLLEKKTGRLKQLPKASTLCGSCEEVCPVKIPIPEMLLHLRDEAGDKGSWAPFAAAAGDSRRWAVAKTGARLGPAIGWSEYREGPTKEGRSFRDWFANRDRPQPPVRSAGHLKSEKVIVPVETPVVDLWADFAARLTLLGGKFIEADSVRAGLELAGVPEGTDRDGRATAGIWDVTYGVTTAELAIAETGTLVLHGHPVRSRMLSLAPPIHVAIIERDRIVATLDGAIPLSAEQNTVWITGPSRTADIEGVLVRGVHGPGEVIVIVVPSGQLSG